MQVAFFLKINKSGGWNKAGLESGSLGWIFSTKEEDYLQNYLID